MIIVHCITYILLPVLCPNAQTGPLNTFCAHCIMSGGLERHLRACRSEYSPDSSIQGQSTIPEFVEPNPLGCSNNKLLTGMVNPRVAQPDACQLQAVNFFSFDMFRKSFTRLGGGTFSNEARLTAGALAGTLAFTASALATIYSSSLSSVSSSTAKFPATSMT